MIGKARLGTVVLEVRRPDAWQAFLDTLLEAPAREAFARHVRLAQGRADDVAALGLELDDAATLEALAERLARHGAPASRSGGTLAFQDPDGTRLEARVAERAAPGDNGFGHAVLATRDLARLERFYVGTLGFAVSERLSARVGPIDVRGVFLHCNRRHHSIALLDLPQRRRLNHLMLEVPSLREVAYAYDRARSARLPFSLDLGEHPDPDGTLSFYVRTPSGFDLEIGAGGSPIEPAGWRELAQTRTSRWGHRPSFGLKVRAAANLVAARLKI
jgi:catechol 2,3-dioxygenase-like lactoylglutathione lyase family enzyme